MNCRYGAACSRPGCWYKHPPGHQAEAEAEAALPPAQAPALCKFGRSCSRADCSFTHPQGRTMHSQWTHNTQGFLSPGAYPWPASQAPHTPSSTGCKFGRGCSRLLCSYSHPVGRSIDEGAGTREAGQAGCESWGALYV